MKIIPTQQLIDIIIKASDQASSVAGKVDNSIKKIGNTSNMLGKIPGFNTLSSKLSGIGSTIKGKLSPYLDSARSKLENLSKGAKGFGSILGPLKSALSMTVGMIGYDLVNGLVSAARASINAASQLDYFGKRLKMSASETTAFREQIDGLQKEFRKVDMTAVGATAEEMAVKFNLPKQSIGDLTRMTAVLSSTFVKEGRTQEDAILAVGDALDGQFKRLQEIGITQDKLKENGWNGNLEDQDSLIKALNKSMEEMGYEQTAKDITNLDEAWGALTIAGGQLLQKVLVPITPVLIKMVDGLIRVADAAGGLISAFGKMPDWAKLGLGVAAFGLALVGVSTAIQIGMIPALGELTAGLAASALAAWDLAAAMLANPLTWVVIALAAVAVAIYEIGKAFGWWTDVNSMLSAIWAGINRLWSAFINHPDVQGIIGAIKGAWDALQPAIQAVVRWVGSFFQSTSGSKFDIVRALIDSISAAWKAGTAPIRLVISVIKLLWTTTQTAGKNIKAVIDKIRNWFSQLPSRIRGAISSLVSVLTSPFNKGYTTIKGIVDKIKNAAKGITNVSISGITSKLTDPFVKAWGRIKPYVDKIKSGINSISGWFGGGAAGFDIEGMLEELNKSQTQVYSTSNNEPVKIEEEITLLFDLRNVPQGTDEQTLRSMIEQLVNDKRFIDGLVRNPEFQSLDQRVKQRITLKNGRARGV